MLYASKLYRQLPSRRRFGVEQNPDDIPDLVAEILTRAVENRIRRNLTHEFRGNRADLTRVRGRIDVLRTERHSLLQRGRIACSFEELTTDTPRNRLVKTALNKLSGDLAGDKDLGRRCRRLAGALDRAGVSDDIGVGTNLRNLQSRASASRTNVDDRQMLAAAELAFSLSLPTEDPGRSRIAAPNRDEAWARKLFERAVGGFYSTVLGPRGWRVDPGKKIDWPVQPETKTAQIDDILPNGGRHRIVIDTKFAEVLKPGHYRSRTLTSGYIYQIYAYLRSQEHNDDPASLNSSGMLLHPAVGEDVDESAVIQGHRIRFATVDLAADSTTIRRRLIDLADDTVMPTQP